MKKSSEINGEQLKKRYFSLTKKLPLEDLKDMLTILFCEPKLVTANDDLEKLPQKEKEKLRDDWIKLTMFDAQRHKQLLLSLDKDIDVFTKSKYKNSFLGEDSDIGDTLATFPKVPLLIETIKEHVNLITTGQKISDDEKIKQIECFTSPASEKSYKIVINGDYEHPLKVSRDKKTWDRFMMLVEDGCLESTEENHDLYDYLNFNPSNKITTNTKYPLQKIIEQYGKQYKPLFKTSIDSEKAFVQRKNKNST